MALDRSPLGTAEGLPSKSWVTAVFGGELPLKPGRLVRDFESSLEQID